MPSNSVSRVEDESKERSTMVNFQDQDKEDRDNIASSPIESEQTAENHDMDESDLTDKMVTLVGVACK